MLALLGVRRKRSPSPDLWVMSSILVMESPATLEKGGKMVARGGVASKLRGLSDDSGNKENRIPDLLKQLLNLIPGEEACVTQDQESFGFAAQSVR